MSQSEPSPRGAFFTSPHHAILALATLGVGFAMGDTAPLLIGAGAYGLGWLYVPDFPFFRNWFKRKQAAFEAVTASAETKAFMARREAMLSSLIPRLKEDYHELARICRDIEQAGGADEFSIEERTRKLDELMWMYLRLLSTEQVLVTFLETEKEEPLEQALKEAQQEIETLKSEVAARRAEGKPSETKERLLSSRSERLESLSKRVARVKEAEDNLQLVRAEEERLVEQIKLIRAEAAATHNSDALSSRISASLAQLNETSRWLTEMGQMQGLAPEPSLPAGRVGYSSWTPPPIPGSTSDQKRRGKIRQG